MRVKGKFNRKIDISREWANKIAIILKSINQVANTNQRKSKEIIFQY